MKDVSPCLSSRETLHYQATNFPKHNASDDLLSSSFSAVLSCRCQIGPEGIIYFLLGQTMTKSVTWARGDIQWWLLCLTVGTVFDQPVTSFLYQRAKNALLADTPAQRYSNVLCCGSVQSDDPRPV
jgi:hypothetical protein